ncbi:dynein light chain Tctex-type 5-like [Amphiura filiformis]|uniref:dynein light chain Tctex-type 5-like n=1 Tax=Amphiura filiformis TaxID=82378 RepID=UPI003B2270AE
MAKFAPAPSIAISAPSRGPSDIEEETSQLETMTTHSTSNNSESGRSSASIEPTYRMEPVTCFQDHTINKIVEDILYDEMKDKSYDSELCKEMAQNLAGKIMEKVKSLDVSRYKYVASVSIGSVREKPGLHISSRCLWNKKTDSSVTVNFMNGSLFAVVMLYGLYLE